MKEKIIQVMLEERMCMSGFIGRERFAHKRQHVFGLQDLIFLGFVIKARKG